MSPTRRRGTLAISILMAWVALTLPRSSRAGFVAEDRDEARLGALPGPIDQSSLVPDRTELKPVLILQPGSIGLDPDAPTVPDRLIARAIEPDRPARSLIFPARPDSAHAVHQLSTPRSVSMLGIGQVVMSGYRYRPGRRAP